MTGFGEIGWMFAPFVICLVLTGIHGYLGIHVLARKVIFVDLAMAQIAALGATFAYLLGYDARFPEDQLMVYSFSLAFTLAGAAVFALTRMRHEKIAQEAFIGITYASASAFAMLILAKSAGEGEHLKQMLVGNVLLVTWPEIAKTAAIYSGIGAFHWFARDKFFLISTEPERAAAEGLNVRLWDFLFYVSFGVVITSSVSIAGVLLVFSYLVVPAVVAMMFAATIVRRITLGWATGALVSLMGMLVSYYGDLPTGPAVVACFAAVLMVAGLTHMVVSSPRKLASLAKIAAAALLLVALGLGSLELRKRPEIHDHDVSFEELVLALNGRDVNAQFEALDQLAARKDTHAVAEILPLLQTTDSDRLIEHIAHLLPVFGDPAAVPVLLDLARRDYDAFLRIGLAKAVLELRDPAGLSVLIEMLGQGEGELAQREAVTLLRTLTGMDFGYRPELQPADNSDAVESWRSWWIEHGPHLRWREQTGRFE